MVVPDYKVGREESGDMRDMDIQWVGRPCEAEQFPVKVGGRDSRGEFLKLTCKSCMVFDKNTVFRYDHEIWELS